ncbi:MAG: hypothetical protein WCK03_03470, partial [Candidatus Taylorbacteria bacterium]
MKLNLNRQLLIAQIRPFINGVNWQKLEISLSFVNTAKEKLKLNPNPINLTARIQRFIAGVSYNLIKKHHQGGDPQPRAAGTCEFL